MKKTDAYALEGKIYPAKALSPKQISEIEKGLFDEQKNKEFALKEANKMLNPSKLKLWARRVAIIAMLTPVAPVASCMINHYYNTPSKVTEKPVGHIPTPEPKTDVKQAKKEPKEEPEKAPEIAENQKWYYEAKDVKERDKVILENFTKFVDSIKNELKEVVKKMPNNSRTEPIEYQLEINNVTFKGLMIVEKFDNKVTLHVLLVGPPCKAGQFHTEAHEPIPQEIEI